MRNFNGYGLFFDIRNPNIRSFNRINAYLNIVERHGKVVGRKYLSIFRRKDKIFILRMLKDMSEVGFEQYRRDFVRNVINV